MRIGIDLGGTKTELLAIDSGGAEIRRVRRATARGDYEGTLRVIADMIAEADGAIGATDTASVGVCIPGSISPASGLVRNANSTWLNGRSLEDDLQAALARPVRIANDADCFALSEAVDGAGAGSDTVFGVILGTGVGGGLVIDQRPINGANGIAGEWGHNPLPGIGPDGRLCWCGRKGCIEAYLSGPGLEREYRKSTGIALDVQGIVKAAEAGEVEAQRVMTRYEQRLGRALSVVINLFDPAVIVLGGGLSNIERLYRSVPKIWNECVFGDHAGTRLLRPRHGDSSGVRGAAWLWPARAAAQDASGGNG